MTSSVSLTITGYLWNHATSSDDDQPFGGIARYHGQGHSKGECQRASRVCWDAFPTLSAHVFY